MRIKTIKAKKQPWVHFALMNYFDVMIKVKKTAVKYFLLKIFAPQTGNTFKKKTWMDFALLREFVQSSRTVDFTEC